MGKISDPEDGKALQNFLICTEMAVAGIALLYAFPHREYQLGGSTAAFRWGAFAHAASIKDVVADAIHVVSAATCVCVCVCVCVCACAAALRVPAHTLCRCAAWHHVRPAVVCCLRVCVQFAPSYSDYVLYTDGGPADNVKRKKFRGQTGVGGAWWEVVVRHAASPAAVRAPRCVMSSAARWPRCARR
jgi:hypothetical protein